MEIKPNLFKIQCLLKSTTHELKIRGFPCNLNMKKRRTHCQIYDEINRRWFRFYESIPITYECKKILKLTNSQDNIGKYVLDYILDYMSHNYLGRNVKEPTLDDINNWCGNGEFPFLEVYLIRNADGVVSLAYYLAR